MPIKLKCLLDEGWWNKFMDSSDAPDQLNIRTYQITEKDLKDWEKMSAIAGLINTLKFIHGDNWMEQLSHKDQMFMAPRIQMLNQAIETHRQTQEKKRAEWLAHNNASIKNYDPLNLIDKPDTVEFRRFYYNNEPGNLKFAYYCPRCFRIRKKLNTHYAVGHECLHCKHGKESPPNALEKQSIISKLQTADIGQSHPPPP